MKANKNIFPGILLCILIRTNLVAAADWPMFRGNALRNGYCTETVGVPETEPEWIVKLGDGTVSSPSIAGDRLFIGCNSGTFYCINIKTGKIIWQKKTLGPIDSSPLLANGLAIVGSRDGKIYVFDQYNGNVVRTIPAGLQLSSPALGPGGEMLTGLGPPHDGFVMYRWENKKTLWKLDFPQMSYSSPAIAGNTALIGANNGRLYCLDLAQKDTAWSYQMRGEIYMASPAIMHGKVYLSPGNRDASVYALSLNDGSLYWKSSNVKLAKSRKPAEPVIPPHVWKQLLRRSPGIRAKVLDRIAQQGYYVPSVLRQKRSGLAKGAAAADGEGFYSYGEVKTSSVAVDPDNVFVIHKELGYPLPKYSIHSFNMKTGRESWRYEELRQDPMIGYCSSPIIANGLVFFGWGEGHAFALDVRQGAVLWQDSLDGHIMSSPAISNKNLYFATTTGSLYKYSLSDATPNGISFANDTYCYPNPARDEAAHIQVFVQRAAELEIVLYSMAEKPVLRIAETLPANKKYTYDWNLSNVANGVYFAVIRARYSDGVEDKKTLKVAVLK